MLLGKILSAIVELKVKSEEFQMAQEKVVMDYRNRRFQQPYQHALLTCHKLLENPFFTHDQRCSVIEKCGIEDLETFKSDFLSSLTVEALIVGNVAEQEAKALM
jgi:secreted Zn-dependent insulinase-like peptidase